jgi:putative ABC transport system substrate-binding protein
VRQFSIVDFRLRIGATATIVVALALFTALPLAESQQPTKVSRVGYLEPGVAAPGTPLFASFRQGLRGLGWVDGQDIAIEIRAAEGKYERLRDLAAELVRLQMDVIFASSTPAALAAKHATTTVPIVMGRVADPGQSGLVASLARPGSNITGWTHQGLELRVKYLDLHKEAVPGATRIGVLWNAANPIHRPSLKHVEATAQALKADLHRVGVQEPTELESAFSAFLRQRVQAVTVFQDGMFLSQAQPILTLAARSRIPVIYGATEFVRAGDLMGYGVNLPDMYRRGASLVDRILKGASPPISPSNSLRSSSWSSISRQPKRLA